MKYLSYILIIFFFTAQNAFAGFLDFNITNTSNIKSGDEVELSVSLNTEGVSYNTVSGTLNVDPGLEIKQIKTGSSIISAWIENPSKSKSNEINFSGIIAGGFSGNGTIFQIILIPKYPGAHNVQIQNSFILLNDGLGTEKSLQDKSLTINARELFEGEQNILITSKDKTSPENFEVILTKDKNIADGKYVLIFEATDKGSGVKTYEVLEGKKLFKQAESPYVLVNQKINERIYVKAIDYDGNERVSKVYIPEKICIGNKCFDQKITILILIFTFILSFIIWRRQSQELKRISERL
jgi:hypothetical protein